MSETGYILQGRRLVKRFQVKKTPTSAAGTLTAVDDVSLGLARGETLGIAGESGCGKSTLSRILAGLIGADSGDIQHRGISIAGMSRSDYAAFRRQTQMIFQDPFSSLNPRMRVGDIIAEPIILSRNVTARQTRHAAETLMTKVGLSPEVWNRFPHEFSGGQRQRIGIARALAVAPEIVIADEPVSSLDISIQAQIINLLQDMKKEYDLSLVIVSHDLSVLRHICDRLCIMYLGAVVESAEAADLFRQCRHPYTEALLSAVPKIRPEPGEKKIILKGDIPSAMAIPPGCRFHTRCPYAEDICRTEPPTLEEQAPGHVAACHFSRQIFKEHSKHPS